MTDILFINAKVLTMDTQSHRAGSVAVSEGIITGVWTEPEPPEGSTDITDKTTIVDLKGETLLPGFIDTHNHILMYALMRDQVNCSTPPNHSITDIVEAIAS